MDGWGQPGVQGSGGFGGGGGPGLLGFEQFQEQHAVGIAVPIPDGHGNTPGGIAQGEETIGPEHGKHQNIGMGKNIAETSRVILGEEGQVQ